MVDTIIEMVARLRNPTRYKKSYYLLKRRKHWKRNRIECSHLVTQNGTGRLVLCTGVLKEGRRIYLVVILTVLTLKKNETSLLVCSYMIHFCLTVVELIGIGREYQECYLRLQVHRVHLDALVLNWIVKSTKRIKRDLKNTMAVTSTRRSAS